MTEADAREWVRSRWGTPAQERLGRFVDMVLRENANQNLISAGSASTIWSRHVVDSAQLLLFSSESENLWLDVGTGAGFPGMIIAILRPAPIMLVEPRARRAAFLDASARELGLHHVRVSQGKVEQTRRSARIISARAVARPDKVFDMTAAVTEPDTLFLLHGGREAETTLMDVRKRYVGLFHVKQSVTEHSSKIIVATGVRYK